jgi:hypothetical protein
MEVRARCVELHPQWEFKLWEDKEADAFARVRYKEEPFARYRGYHQGTSGEGMLRQSRFKGPDGSYLTEIMRSNVLRYLALHHYEGIYLDLPSTSFGCRTSQASVLTALFRRSLLILSSSTISLFPQRNQPGSTTLSYTSPFSLHFFSTMHLRYPNRIDDMNVLPWSYRLNGPVTSLFARLEASFWHKADAAIILSLGQVVRFLPSF